MESPFASAFRPCIMVLPEAYTALVQERWDVFAHEVEQLARCILGLSVVVGDSAATGSWSPRGLIPGLRYFDGEESLEGTSHARTLRRHRRVRIRRGPRATASPRPRTAW